MASDSNNINELVEEDDDPTVELQAPSFLLNSDNLSEADARTFDEHDDGDKELPPGVTVSELEFDQQSRKKTIDQLQCDIQQLHAKWLGLETEIGVRQTQTDQLNIEIKSLRDVAARKSSLIKKRDRKIKSLKLEIRQRDESFRQLTSRYENLRLTQADRSSPSQKSEPGTSNSNHDFDAGNHQRRLQQSEQYADSIRQQSQDLIQTNSRLERQIENLSQSLSGGSQENARLRDERALMVASVENMQAELDAIRLQHDNEIRMLRFELGEAQNTVVQTDDMNHQLASDLIDAHTFKEGLERVLGEVEERSAVRIKELQKEVIKLNRKAENLEQKLTTKSEAISILLSELAKKSEHIESIGEIEDVIHDIDERMSEHSFKNDVNSKRTPVDRITRVLLGTVDGQVLRFPLFKDRLTIGRTKDNDIQLKAASVSRRHAVIQTDGEQTRIVDWDSKNGIQVNSEKVSEQILAHGDVVMIGDARFRYEERKKRDS